MKYVLLFAAGILAPFPTSAQKDPAPYVILVSFDGFRHDYVKAYSPPNFIEFISKGSQAESLIPSFPSKTFPNHYTIVTGLYPGHHGLVDNQFYDRKQNATYGMRDKEMVKQSYYYGGVPLWQLARENGLKSASYFWVGSEMSEEGRHPDYYFSFDDKVPPQSRVDQVLAWLSLPEKERPHMITLYFSFPDHEGHLSGPNSRQTRHAVMHADTLLGNLMKGLKSIPLPVNVILVSDHGMSELTVQEETYVFVDQLINRKDGSVIVANGGTQAHIYLSNPNKIDSLYTLLKSKEKNFKIYRQKDFPQGWHYQSERSGDLLLVMTPGHYSREYTWIEFLKTAKVGTKFGVHGYDPAEVTDMRGIFYAQGPNIKTGVTVPAFQNIHIYPFIANILGLPIPTIDGKGSVLKGIIKK